MADALTSPITGPGIPVDIAKGLADRVFLLPSVRHVEQAFKLHSLQLWKELLLNEDEAAPFDKAVWFSVVVKMM
jgi:hypothetical protein